MVLYRFLFAPVLLAVAVITGAPGGSRAHASRLERVEQPERAVVEHVVVERVGVAAARGEREPVAGAAR